MIDSALNLLRSEINVYFQTLPSQPDPNPVVIANVAAVEQDNGTAGFDSKVLLTLVNIEEESSFKNLPASSKTTGGGVTYANPPIYLNLYLLFSSHFPIGQYDNALRQISNVIRFFQGRRTFNLANSPNFQPSEITPDIAALELFTNLYTMTFEQINHLWGSLGGKQMPFVMYKARLVCIDAHLQKGAGTLIEEIAITEKAEMEN